MRVERDEGTPSWCRFWELLDLCFGPPLRSNPLGELAACRRTGTVADYQERFLALLTCAGPLTESQQMQLFVAGLQEPLSIDVQLQGPQSLEVAMSLARSFERREQVLLPPPRANRSTPSHALLPAPTTAPCPAVDAPPGPLSTGAPVASPGTVTVAGRSVRRLSPAEIDERRHNGQCF